ncbi:MAG: amidohydrolase family protein [Anaerolineae bacterium]|nr:amidohydrolase family protein [Anaerolineae bacterium]
MKIDAHQHFWRYTPAEYGWIGSNMEILKNDHLPANLALLTRTVDIEGTVAVQARQTLTETEWLLDLADHYALIKGVVGWVDLCGPDLREQLERFVDHPKFCGVRHLVQDEPDDRFMLREDFIRGISLLAEFDLTYDILIFPRQLSAACELVAIFPNQPFVLDHIAKPFIKDGLIEPWSANIRQLATFPNVFCKVSGMVTEAHWRQWKPADFQPYLQIVFEAFGPQRIMFGSDWPVCLLAATYTKVVKIVADYVWQLSKTEQAMVWGETARKFYGLEQNQNT